LLNINNKTYVVDLPGGYISFRSIVVKLFYTQESNQSASKQSTKHYYNSELDNNIIVIQILKLELESTTSTKRGRNKPRKNFLPDIIVFIQEQFFDSCCAKIIGLLEKNVFEIINRIIIPQTYVFLTLDLLTK
jgi:hypothetical protein